MSSLPLHKANLAPDRRREEPAADPDREALEHIARALESRRFQKQAQSDPHERSEPNTELFLTPESLKALLEGIPAAAGILVSGTLTHANSAFANAFGYPSAEELLDAGGLDAILSDGTVLAREASAENEPVDALTRSNRRVKVAFSFSVLDAERDIKLLLLIDRASLDALTSENASAEAAPEPAPAPAAQSDASSGRLEFLARVSHEVRTPLNSIIGFAELMLQERFGPIGNRRYTGYVEDIHQSGLYALSLLNDLLDISKIEAGKFELNFTAVDVAEIVEDCVASLQPLAKRARILLRTSLGPDLPTVVADPRRLKQILLNLLTNAIKFTKEGGQVIVSGSMIAGELRLRVHDNGVGMTKDEIAFAMQPFHQLDTAPRKQTGTGLGLPVTKALVDANRARLVLTSEPDIGTSADVIFPAERLFVAG